MKISIQKELKSRFKRPKTEEEYKEIINYLSEKGVAVGNLYQELEMSSSLVNFHRDTTFVKQNISIHSHSFFEIMYCRSSDRVEYLVGSRRYRLSAGDLIIVAPGVSHRPIFPDDMQYPYERDILWVSLDFMKKVSQIFPSTNINSSGGAAFLRTKGTNYGYIADYFTGGIQESESELVGSEESTAAIALLILTHAYRAMNSCDSVSFGAEKPTLINSLIEYIEGNLDSPLTLGDTAAHFYVSRGTVNKAFRDTMDTTFHKFLTQRRLILAKLLIKEGEGMDRVAEKCGFSDYSVFYKAFKKEYGLSPRAFYKL
ncbi:MAG: helix-turn-helix domain-containing protein [Ruminococcaceae bacterium]|nr:helix-turn-helix domain-containing protein [Oscillospiraceae bacterium]